MAAADEGAGRRHRDDHPDTSAQPTEWFLLVGNRLVVAGIVLLAILGVLSLLLAVEVVAVGDDDVITRGFVALVTGNFTLITIVISINQLILSREFGTPDELHERIREVIAFRHDVESAIDSPLSPISPESFLDFLARIVEDHAESLREETAEAPAEELETDANEFAETLIAQSEEITSALETSDGGAFTTLLTILSTDFAQDFHTAERIRATHRTALSDDAEEVLDEIIHLIEFMGVARQYFKTLYIQRELAAFSRKILYAGLPALVGSIVVIWIYGHAGGPRVDSPTLDAIVTLGAVLAFGPLAVFVSYILRVATVARRTASLLPFEIPEESSL